MVMAALKMRKMAAYRPYPKQMLFHELGKTKRERAMMAGNQLGKTMSAGYEMAFHVTGDYPEWWPGRKFPGPTKWWVACTNNETVRDNPQRLLMGEPGDWGTGTIPRSAIAKTPTMSRGFPDLIDTVLIKHKSGGISSIQFKAYDQGRKRWQGATLTGGLWLDEEPPADIYSEAQARIAATSGMIFLTMTPLLGISEVVSYFYPEPSNEYRALVMLEIEEVQHLTDEEKDAVIASYPEHEREARSRGVPLLGEGLVFAVPRSSIECEPFQIPGFWAQLGGLDFGYGDHPFAACRVAYDRDSDTMYLTHVYKEKQPIPAVHVSSLKQWGDELQFFPPHDAQRNWGDSGPVAEVYRREGLKIWHEHATFKEGGYSPEAAVQALMSRMQTGRFKAFSHLEQFWQEVSTYHRKDGKLVQERDDVLSALFKCVMMLRFARTIDRPLGAQETVVSDWDEFDFTSHTE